MKKKQYNTPEKTFVTFHIGRGGHFWNAGHKSYLDQDKTIDSYTDELFVSYQNTMDIANAFGKRSNLLALLQLANDGNLAAGDRLSRMGFDLGKKVYTDCNGNYVGLNVENDGTGRINQDNDYDTTIVKRLEDCDQNELQLIYDSKHYVSTDVKDYCRAALGVEEKENAII